MVIPVCCSRRSRSLAAQPFQNQKNELADVFKILHTCMSDNQRHGFCADPAHELVAEIGLIAEPLRGFAYQTACLLRTGIRCPVVQNLRDSRHRKMAALCHIPQGGPPDFPFRRQCCLLNTKIVIQICLYFNYTRNPQICQ